MTTREKMLDIARVYQAYGAGHARARLVYHGWTVDDPRLESLLTIVAELAERLPVQEALIAPVYIIAYVRPKQRVA